MDDVVLVLPYNSIKPRFFSVSLNKEEKMLAVTEATCTIRRAHESETIDVKEKDRFFYVVQCKDFLGLFSMSTLDLSVEVIFKTQGGSKLGTMWHGFLQRAFKSQ